MVTGEMVQHVKFFNGCVLLGVVELNMYFYVSNNISQVHRVERDR